VVLAGVTYSADPVASLRPRGRPVGVDAAFVGDNDKGTNVRALAAAVAVETVGKERRVTSMLALTNRVRVSTASCSRSCNLSANSATCHQNTPHM
jgi:hypothetical protein